MVIALFLSVLSILPRHCARLTYFFHLKLRKINEALITPQLITLGLWRLRPTGSIPVASIPVATSCSFLATSGGSLECDN